MSWPVTVQMGDRLLHLRTVNLSPFGAKVALGEPLPVGSPARLRLEPPGGRPVDVQTIVWRTDPDGPAFFFIGAPADEYTFPGMPSSTGEAGASRSAPRGDA